MSVKRQCIFFISALSVLRLIRGSLSDLINIDSSLPTENDEKLLGIKLYANKKFNTKTNDNILMCTLKFIIVSQRFENSLWDHTFMTPTRKGVGESCNLSRVCGFYCF